MDRGAYVRKLRLTAPNWSDRGCVVYSRVRQTWVKDSRHQSIEIAAPSWKSATKFSLSTLAAVLERIAVEEDVARDGAAVDAGEDIGAQRAIGLEEIAAGQRRIDAQRSVIVRQVDAEARHRAGIDIVIDVAERRAVMRLDVEEQSQKRLRRDDLEGALIGELHDGLVAQLVMPAGGSRLTDDGVHEALRVRC